MRIIIIENANAAILSQILSNPSYNRSNVFTEHNSEKDSDCPLLDAVEKETGFRIEDHGVASPGMEPEPIKFENDSKEFWAQPVRAIVNSYVDSLQPGDTFFTKQLAELICNKKLELLSQKYSLSGANAVASTHIALRKDLYHMGWRRGFKKI
jgi:hypothetical protein